MSSDQIIKLEIKDKVKKFPNINLRIFPDGSNQDQKLVEDGGLTFSYNGVDYGSCDAGWFQEIDNDGEIIEVPLIALEGTDALNRGSAGNAQYQRFHHALGAVKNGYIGIYYLRKGTNKLQLDLYKMAYNATKFEDGDGVYLIIQDLDIVSEILELISSYGRDSNEVKTYLNKKVEEMHQAWENEKFSQYNNNWCVFAEKRSTIIRPDNIIKYTGRMKRNFTDGSQRAGHIAVGEMYLSKYLFYGKKVYYLCPRMSRKDVDYLDEHKSEDKEWYLLRHEKDVYVKTRDDLEGLSQEIYNELVSISEEPLKGDALKTYNKCILKMVKGIKSGTIKIKI
ncbi:MAG: hypothetical protein IKJ50_04845 [Clostridia bacterium]|nr:hypothetical protein [Clostridia bacterium]